MSSALAPELLRAVEEIVGPEHVVHRPEELLVFEYDAYLETGAPTLVAQPGNAEELSRLVQVAAEAGLAIVPRGGATGLSGGVVAVRGGLMVDLNRMHRLLETRPDDRLARVQPGLVNSELSALVLDQGLYYAPDPSSQRASTIGGNIGENAGGPHCLARGMTTNHVVGVELVAADGERYSLGGPAPDGPGYDLTGLVVGSEGTFGIVAEAWVRLLPLPPATVTFLALFETLELAGETVSAIIASGIIPSALEMIDGGTLRAIEQAFGAGFPADAEGLLLVELDGRPEDVAEQALLVEAVCERSGARGLRQAQSAEEREKLWAARKGGLAALSYIAPNYYLHDMVVPRSKMAEVLRQVLAVGEHYGFFVSNIAHAGDGNLHPTIMFDLRTPDILPRVIQAGEEILMIGVEAGGTISGEHGIGLEKQEYMAWIFSADDLALMKRVREAFNPGERLNPGKVFPQAMKRVPRVKVWSSRAVTAETWI